MKRKFLNVFWLVVVVAATNISHADELGITDASSSLVGPDPSEVKIHKIAYAGSGCPAGSVSEVLSPDAKAFTLLFDSYIAEAGPGIPLSQGRKNCNVAVDLRFPNGWSFTVIDVDYRGYMNLERGTSGLQKTDYFFAGQSMGPSLQSTFVGPADRDYNIRDSLLMSAAVWSPCGLTRALNLNTQVRVSASGGRRALLTNDSINGELTHLYGIRWRRCQ